MAPVQLSEQRATSLQVLFTQLIVSFSVHSGRHTEPQVLVLTGNDQVQVGCALASHITPKRSTILASIIAKFNSSFSHIRSAFGKGK